ncbi:hypothetical protein FA15DRAFT_663561 [Coprinopsis marcescibilis]|uniref:F-box domain-containing protein n=1 Tax=Coprinopsis marcescibilis TaxID=230819 RepID=A0A5C3LBN9_COPMA|nr:hypothetical protein FA15DRAFT_663561 [Coprinopsis marcescibilis]
MAETSTSLPSPLQDTNNGKTIQRNPTTRTQPRKKLKVKKTRSSTSNHHQVSPPPSKIVVELPHDVYWEVFQYLLPADLVSLSRTNKSFRGTLMWKGAKSVWKASFDRLEGNIPPPECPNDMTLAHYAVLLFDNRCFECNRTRRRGWKVYWKVYARLCGRCFKAEFSEQPAALGADIAGAISSYDIGGNLLYSISELKAMRAALERLTVLGTVKEVHDNQETALDAKGYIGSAMNKCSARNEVAGKMCWHEKRIKRQDRDVRMKARRKLIRERLVVLGYPETAVYGVLSGMYGVRGVHRVAPLTDEVG